MIYSRMPAQLLTDKPKCGKQPSGLVVTAVNMPPQNCLLFHLARFPIAKIPVQKDPLQQFVSKLFSIEKIKLRRNVEISFLLVKP